MKDEEDTVKVLSGASPIQVKFIGWLVVVLAGGFGGCIWWAATMSTKLDVVIANQSVQMAAIKAVVEDVSRLKEWRVQVDTVGSPTIAKEVGEMRQQINDLQKQLDMHKLATKAP